MSQYGPKEPVKIHSGNEPAPTIMAKGIADVRPDQAGIVTGPLELTMDDSKPPYRVPTMAEVEATEPNGFTAASSFSGCGGSCLGYRMAGFRVAWANEFIPAAAETYRANHPGTVLDTRDIRTISPDEVLAALGMKAGELDLWDGSPPCASFSTAGKRAEHWGQERAYSDTVQRTDDLFFEYVRLLAGIQPRVFVAENVTGLVKGVAKGYFKEIHAALRGAGYRVKAAKLDASWLGVPQARQRIIFVGVRSDLDAEPVFPRPLPYRYSVRDALPWINQQSMMTMEAHGWYPGRVIDTDTEPAATVRAMYPGDPQVRVIHDTEGQYSQGDVTDRPLPAVLAGDSGPGKRRSEMLRLTGSQVTVDPETGEDITLGRYAIGREWQRMSRGGPSKYRSSLRPDSDAPLPTVRANAEGGLKSADHGNHWADCRKLTLGELRALSGFPPDFVLTGSYAQRWERIGRAVPPVMMAHIAAAVRDQILIPLRDR